MSETTKAEYFCERCQVHWSGTHRCRDRIDAQRAIEAENQSLRAQLLADRKEHFEEAAKMAEGYLKAAGPIPREVIATVATDFAHDAYRAFQAHTQATASRIAAALRAKGAGK